MKLIMYGVNRDTVSSDDIHKYGLNKTMRERHLKDISSFEGVDELVLVATENRNEYYLYIDEQTFKHGDLLRYLSYHTGKCLEEIILETYSKFNNGVVKHLYHLTSTVSERSESVTILEQSLIEGSRNGSVGSVLSDLFNRAIHFSLSLYDKEQLYPLLNGDVSRAIQNIRKDFPVKQDINYLFIGNNETINQLVKYVIGEPSSYLTFLERNEKSKELISNVKKWLEISNNVDWKNHIYSVDISQLIYRFSKADIVIIGPSVRNAWISNELLEDMHEMRPTAKKQLIIDLSGSQEETLFFKYPTLKYTQINDIPENVFSLDKIEEAKAYYEEYLAIQATEYMGYFTQMNESNISHLPTREKVIQNVSYVKKISYKV